MSSRVILIDDDENDIRIASTAIQKVAPNAKLQVIRDGENALRTLTAAPVNARVVLLDLAIPRISGMEILRALKEAKPHKRPPLIIFSVSGDRQTIEEARNNGATAYLVKPSDP